MAAQAPRLADCPELAEIIETAVALLGTDLIRLDAEDALTDWLDRIEHELADLDRRFYRLEATIVLDAAQARLVGGLGYG